MSLPTAGPSWGAASPPRNARDTHISDGLDGCLSVPYQRALAAFASAMNAVDTLAAGLSSAQEADVSARVGGRSGKKPITGTKRKMSPCVYTHAEFEAGPSSCGGKADTPTQELLPASRRELRNHQLQAVRWLVSLERQGASGVLADELQADRRAAVAGLLSHLATTPPEPTQPSGRGSSAAAPLANVCVLLAPGCSLTSWSECIRGHVDVQVMVHDGSPASAAALTTRCQGSCEPAPLQQQQHAPFALMPSQQSSRRAACGGAYPGGMPAPGAPSFGSSSSSNSLFPTSSGSFGCGPTGVLGARPGSGSSAAGVHPSHQHPHTHMPLLPAGAAGHGAHGLPGGYRHSLLVVLSPLEHLQRDAALLAQLPVRVMVADLAPQRPQQPHQQQHHHHLRQHTVQQQLFRAGSGGSGMDACSGRSPHRGASMGSGDGYEPMATCGLGLSAPPPFPMVPEEDEEDNGEAEPQGMDFGSAAAAGAAPDHLYLHLLARLPAGCRVLLSGGDVQPPPDSIWSLLQLLAPHVQRPLWEAVGELQHALLSCGHKVSPNSKEGVMAEMHRRLVALLRPLVLHRAAHDVDLSALRSNNTSLNLYDHFSAAEGMGL